MEQQTSRQGREPSSIFDTKEKHEGFAIGTTLSRSELNEAVGDALSSLQNFIQGVVKVQGTMNISADFFTINQFPLITRTPRLI